MQQGEQLSIVALIKIVEIVLKGLHVRQHSLQFLLPPIDLRLVVLRQLNLFVGFTSELILFLLEECLFLFYFFHEFIVGFATREDLLLLQLLLSFIQFCNLCDYLSASFLVSGRGTLRLCSSLFRVDVQRL